MALKEAVIRIPEKSWYAVEEKVRKKFGNPIAWSGGPRMIKKSYHGCLSLKYIKEIGEEIYSKCLLVFPGNQKDLGTKLNNLVEEARGIMN